MEEERTRVADGLRDGDDVGRGGRDDRIDGDSALVFRYGAHGIHRIAEQLALKLVAVAPQRPQSRQLPFVVARATVRSSVRAEATPPSSGWRCSIVDAPLGSFNEWLWFQRDRR